MFLSLTKLNFSKYIKLLQDVSSVVEEYQLSKTFSRNNALNQTHRILVQQPISAAEVITNQPSMTSLVTHLRSVLATFGRPLSLLDLSLVLDNVEKLLLGLSNQILVHLVLLPFLFLATRQQIP